MLMRRSFWMIWVLAAVAASPAWTKSITLATQDAGPAGSDVVVRLTIDTDGEPLAALDASFTFDDDVLELRGVYKTALVDDFMLLHAELPDPLPDDAPDTIDLGLFTDMPLALADGEHEVVWVLFRVLADGGASSLVLDPATSEINEDAATEVNDGEVTSITADAAFIVPDDASGAPMTVVEVPVIVDPADGLQSFDITLEFNPEVIQAVSVTTTDATASFTLTPNLTTPGRVIISLFDDEPVVGMGALEVARISFDVVGALGDETPLDLTVGITEDGVSTYLDDGLFRICDDGDGDGFTACNDCDDTNPDVYPGAPQLCDGLDNDCGPGWPMVPADETDDDGDFYVECTPWTGAPGTFGGDCDDADPLINPGAAEDCDLVDDDCDGSLDNGMADASCDDGNVCTTQTCEMGMCVSSPSGVCSLSGAVVYYRDADDGDEPSDPEKGVPDVSITLSGTVNAGPIMTDALGDYSFPNVFGSVTVSAGPKLDTVNDAAVSSFDAARVAQYVVNPVGNPLSAMQLIAADVSNNTSISSFDAALIAQYGTGIRSPYGAGGPLPHLPVANANQSDWAIVPPSLAYPMVSGGVTDADFVAILYGDVTGNWTAPPPPPADLAGDPAPVSSPRQGRVTMAQAASAASTAPAQTAPATVISSVARIYLASTVAIAGGTRVTLGITGADGILGMDLVLDAANNGFEVTEIALAGLASGSQLYSHDDGGTVRISVVSVEPLAGSGGFLNLTVSGDALAVRRVLRALQVEANEGQIPVVIDGGASPILPRSGGPAAGAFQNLRRAD